MRRTGTPRSGKRQTSVTQDARTSQPKPAQCSATGSPTGRSAARRTLASIEQLDGLERADQAAVATGGWRQPVERRPGEGHLTRVRNEPRQRVDEAGLAGAVGPISPVSDPAGSSMLTPSTARTPPYRTVGDAVASSGASARTARGGSIAGKGRRIPGWSAGGRRRPSEPYT